MYIYIFQMIFWLFVDRFVKYFSTGLILKKRAWLVNATQPLSHDLGNCHTVMLCAYIKVNLHHTLKPWLD